MPVAWGRAGADPEASIQALRQGVGVRPAPEPTGVRGSSRGLAPAPD